MANSHVYLVQNGDLYNIGNTSNLERTKKNLQPGTLIASLKSEKGEDICSKLQDLYSPARLPQSNYFRLSRSQAIECKKQLEEIGGSNYFQPFFIGGKLFIAFFMAWIIISYIIITIGIDPIFSKFS